MSKDIIYRQAALDIAFKYCPDDDGICSEAGSDMRNMLDEIEALPSAQPELIRCKDCVNFSFCQRYGCKEDDFCSFAEKENRCRYER